MKKLFFFNGLLTALLLCACTAEDSIISEIPVNSGIAGGIVIDVMDANSDNMTRTTYSGLTASFETGDAIGVYAVDGTGAVQASNIQFTKQSDGSWSSETLVPYNAAWSYYAYFPYVAAPYTPDFSLSGVDSQFGAFIADTSDKFHNADQSTKAIFMASDLMISMGTSTGSSKVLFAMYHKKALAVLLGEGVNMKSYSGNIPYLQDGKRYFLMKANTEYTVGGYALSAGAGKAINCVVPLPPYEEQYLTFVALEDGAFKFDKDGLSYSIDGGATWTALNANTSTPTITAGQKIIWKNNKSMTPDSNYGIGKFTATGNFSAEGNIMSLLYGDSFVGQSSLSGKDYAFHNLFNSNNKLININKLILPATTLSEACYDNMFSYCKGLTSVPEGLLPATTLANYCYCNMFINCESLTKAPRLPATTLANYCYRSMFESCRALTTPPELPATTLVNNCYSFMFYDCTALTTAPELPAKTLTSDCYRYMFCNCSNLNYIKAAFTTSPGVAYTQDWVRGVSTTGTYVKSSAATWFIYSYIGTSGIPSGWTIETYTP